MESVFITPSEEYVGLCVLQCHDSCYPSPLVRGPFCRPSLPAVALVVQSPPLS